MFQEHRYTPKYWKNEQNGVYHMFFSLVCSRKLLLCPELYWYAVLSSLRVFVSFCLGSSFASEVERKGGVHVCAMQRATSLDTLGCAPSHKHSHEFGSPHRSLHDTKPFKRCTH
eukprot:5393305-Amphidinium_carterae.1